MKTVRVVPLVRKPGETGHRTVRATHTEEGGLAGMKREKQLMRLCRMVASDVVMGLAQGSVAVAVGQYD
jgi:hypothetical protein